MKTIFKSTVIYVMCMLVSIITFGQEKKQYFDEIKGVKMSPPRFIGNENLSAVLNQTQFRSINDYLAKQIQYPEKSKDWQEEGTEVIQFVVTPKSEVTDLRIINSVSSEIDREVIRVLKTTNGLWMPGLNNGQPVAMGKEISINFKFCNSADEINSATNFVDLAKQYFNKGNRQLFVKENIKSALRQYNKAICYLPNDKSILAIRGICKYELGDKNGACTDWNRVKALGGLTTDYYLDKFCELKGYSELVSSLQEKK